MDPNRVYYSNTGKGSELTRQLIDKFFRALARNLSDDSFLNFVSESRVPNERELYGIFVKSLNESCGNDLGHIATEFQVAREDSKGRVDLLFNFSTVKYLVELKVGLVNAIDNGNEPKISARDIWDRAIDQLDDLKIDSVGGMMKNKTVVMLPIALYFFTSRRLEPNLVDHKKTHKKIYDLLANDMPEREPDFKYYSAIPCTPTRFRQTELGKPVNKYLYGFSIFSKELL